MFRKIIEFCLAIYWAIIALSLLALFVFAVLVITNNF